MGGDGQGFAESTRGKVFMQPQVETEGRICAALRCSGDLCETLTDRHEVKEETETRELGVSDMMRRRGMQLHQDSGCITYHSGHPGLLVEDSTAV